MLGIERLVQGNVVVSFRGGDDACLAARHFHVATWEHDKPAMTILASKSASSSHLIALEICDGTSKRSVHPFRQAPSLISRSRYDTTNLGGAALVGEVACVDKDVALGQVHGAVVGV